MPNVAAASTALIALPTLRDQRSSAYTDKSTTPVPFLPPFLSPAHTHTRTCTSTQAAKHYVLAAIGGVPAARYNLAFMYEAGAGGLRPSVDRALQLFDSAAELGHGPAAAALAERLFRGVVRDPAGGGTGEGDPEVLPTPPPAPTPAVRCPFCRSLPTPLPTPHAYTYAAAFFFLDLCAAAASTVAPIASFAL